MKYVPNEEVICEYPKCKRRAVIEIFDNKNNSIKVCIPCRKAVIYNLDHLDKFYPSWSKK